MWRKYAPPLGASSILGVEVGGTVIESRSPFLNVGERVMALLSGGGYAQFAVAPASLCMRIPKHLSFQQAAAIPEAWITAFQLLSIVADLKKGETVLIHAAGSGVGNAAIQLSKLIGAKSIFVTARSAEKLTLCSELGATNLINYKENPNFSNIVLEMTDGRGVDVILDCVGATHYHQNIRSAAMDARLLSGSEINCDLALLMSILTSTLRHRHLDYRSNLIEKFKEIVLPGFEDNTYKVIIDSIFPIAEVELAHNRMTQNKNCGKIILTWDSD
ncbi:putative quinone oxidoreductase [Cardiosporidium cionae]|uniref:Quinone oxidoreductase n=1 Tax=Cardiosporidium cionae TaxID=476202 RepID=A0ABQ7JG95_9APIC|nr:putative quinone oxidoreductase [Cardiosporidium cionae]|eukprot:KAF8823042.1 putative quinone oxidoreductase [Cardiosporidium cionae]